MRQTQRVNTSPEDPGKHVCEDSAREQAVWLELQVSSGLAPTLLSKALNPWGNYWEGPQERSQFPARAERTTGQARHCTALSPGALLPSFRMPADSAVGPVLDQTIK